MLVVLDKMLPKLSFVLIFLHESSDADDEVMTLDWGVTNPLQLADSGFFQALQFQFLDFILREKHVFYFVEVKKISFYFFIHELVLKDREQVAESLRVLQTYYLSSYGVNVLDEKLKDLAKDAVIPLRNTLGEYDKDEFVELVNKRCFKMLLLLNILSLGVSRCLFRHSWRMKIWMNWMSDVRVSFWQLLVYERMI